MIGDTSLSRLTAQAGQKLGIEVKLIRPDSTATGTLTPSRTDITAFGTRSDSHPQPNGYEVISCCGTANNSMYLRSMAAAGYTVRPSPKALELRSSNPLARELLLRLGFQVSPGYRQADPVPDHPQPPTTALADRKFVVVLVARSPSGWTVAYPVAEDVHESPAGPATVVPARISDDVADRVTTTAKSIVDGLDTNGIVAVHMLVSPLSTATPMIIMDIYSGPQYSGLFTMDAAATSQFDNHLRAILDWPLGPTHLHTPAAATIRLHLPLDPTRIHQRISHALANPDIRINVHPGPRNNRYIHVTALSGTSEAALSAAQAAAHAFTIPSPLPRH